MNLPRSLAVTFLGDANGTLLCGHELHRPCSDVLLLFPERPLGTWIVSTGWDGAVYDFQESLIGGLRGAHGRHLHGYVLQLFCRSKMPEGPRLVFAVET